MHLVDITMFYAAEGGGVRTYLSAKAAWLKKSRIQHTVVSSGTDDHGGAALVGVPGIPIPWANAYCMPLSIRMTARRLAALRPDLIEAGDACHFAWAALRAGRRLGVPTVAFYHSDLQQIIGSRLGTIAMRSAAAYTARLYRQFDLVLAPSQTMVRRLQEMGIERVQHQPLGVDTLTHAPERRDPDLRRRLGLPDDARLLVFAGRLTREKKLHVLLEAMRMLGEPYRLLLIGAGRVPCSEHVIHLPFQREPSALASLLASCDALVHPGDQETFGLVVLEAMACGLPVIGMAAGGVAELVDDETGLLVNPGNAAELADAVRQLYRLDIARLGANARKKAVDCYDWNVIIPQLVAQYGRLFAVRQREELEKGLSYATE